MKRRTKIIIGIIALIVVVTGILLTRYLISVQRYQHTVASMTYDNIDASNIPDGTYIGECDVNFIYAKVSVAVENGVIVSIDLLEHRHGRGESAEGIEQQIVAEQRVDVDAVSGATNSSTVIKKAVDNALTSKGSKRDET